MGLRVISNFEVYGNGIKMEYRDGSSQLWKYTANQNARIFIKLAKSKIIGKAWIEPTKSYDVSTEETLLENRYFGVLYES